jgi:hypothetical protein
MRAMLPSALLALLSLFPRLDAGENVKQAAARKINQAVVVDGRLDETVWAEAPELGGFVQFEPRRGEPASRETFVRILYDERRIYFGFVCRDSEPEKIAARLSKRDSDLGEDDSVSVYLDTFLDRRNCYFFVTNLRGAQSDGRITDNGLNTDLTWDGTWQSAAAWTEDGWTAEAAVELSCLKFKPGRDVAWGLNLGRAIPRGLERSYWSGVMESPAKAAQFGVLAGLDIEPAADRLQLVPHAVAKAEEGRRSELDLGLDARYALSQAVSGDLTLNPDFATVETDQEQVNLTRFELSLPEKRNFFLEGSEIYRQRITLFYSRRIGDIHGGLKLYGKAGGFEFSGLGALTRESGAPGGEAALFSVFRLKKDIMKSSTVGFLLADRSAGGAHRGTAGLDVSLDFSRTFKFTGQLAASYGERDEENIAFFLRPAYDSATAHFHVRYTQLGRYFGDNANAVGFVRDDNRRELDSALSKTFWIRKRGVDRLEYDSNYNIYWGFDGELRSWQVDQGLTLDLSNKLSLEAEHTEEYKLFEKGFRNRETGLTAGYNTREWQSAALDFKFGRNFDSDFRLVEGRLAAKLTEDLSLEYSFARLVLNPDPERETTWIHVVRATHNFTKDLFLKAFFQVNSSIDKRTAQVLFVYRFLPPFGLVQLAYQQGAARFGERGNQGHSLFLKVAWVF